MGAFMYPRKRERIVDGILLLIIVMLTLLFVHATHSNQGNPIILSRNLIGELKIGRIYGYIPMDEKYVILEDSKGKERIYCVEDKELLDWIKKHQFFSRQGGLLCPRDVANNLMSDCLVIKLTKEEKK